MAIGSPYTIVSGHAAAGSTTLQVTVSATSVAGDAIVVCASCDSNTPTITAMADSQGNSYTQAALGNFGDGATLTGSCWVALNTTPLVNGTDWIKATYNSTAGTKALNGRGCSGIATVNATDTDAVSSGTSTSPSSGSSGTLAQAAEWAVAFLVTLNAGGTPSAWTGGYAAANTAHQSSGVYQTVADQVVSSTAALNAGATISSTHWALLQVTLKGAAGAVTLVNDFDEGTNGATVSTGNSGGGGQNAFGKVSIGSGATVTYDSGHTAHGTEACKITNGGSAAQAFTEWAASLGSQNKVWFRIYCYLTGNPALNFGIVRYLTGTGGSQVARLAITSAGKITFNDGGNTTRLTSTNTIPLNAYFRVEGFAYGSSTVGQLEFKLFTSMDSTSPAETQTSAATLNTTGVIGAADFGMAGTGLANGTYWMDDIGVSTGGYLGPAGATTTGNLLLLFP